MTKIDELGRKLRNQEMRSEEFLYSGIKYKSNLDDLGISLDGWAIGEGWQAYIYTESDNEVCWAKDLEVLLSYLMVRICLDDESEF
jgi:hypothetical protein